jgi:hypothetical protein
MEVHHHPQVEKKNFKEYLLEGLMIFFAVMLGFFAENIRENIVEHNRAQVLAQSLFEDIKKDTAALHTVIDFSYKKESAADSTIVVLHLKPDEWNDTVIYRGLLTIATIYPFNATQGTYDQIKASGTLSYFDQSLVNQMNAYDVQVKKTAFRDNLESQHLIDYVLPFNQNTINNEVLYDLRFKLPITHEMYINTNDKLTIKKLINLVVDIKIVRQRSLIEYEQQLKIAGILIKALQKKYQLENE